VSISVISDFPSQKQIKGCLTTKMYHIHLCPGTEGYTHLNQISPFVQKAVVLSEDSAFFAHHGFDLDEIEKSIKKNIKTGKYARGGSTISQQLSKNMFLTEEKSLLRKLKEAIITIRLEKTLSKKEILERYLNIVHLGKDIFGIKKAAQFYFKKSPAELNLSESVFLVFLLPSPEKYSKSFYKAQLTPFAESRLNQIVESLYMYERITTEEYLAGKEGIKYLFKNSIPAPIENQTVPEELDSEETAEDETT
jgi:monofunctional biosynthetic peptidoglycan transglycosylase